MPSVGEEQIKGILMYSWWDYKFVQLLWKTEWRFCKKLDTELPYALTIPGWGIYIQKYLTQDLKDTCTLMFTAALFTATKTRKQLKCPSMDKENVNTHTHTYIQSNSIQP